MSEFSRLPGVGPKRAAVLEEAGLASLRDLIYYLPRKYIDRTIFHRIADLQEKFLGEGREEPLPENLEINVVAQVEQVSEMGSGGRGRLQVEVRDGTGTLMLLYFNGISFWKRRFAPGQRLHIWGKVSFFGKLQVVHPQLTFLKQGETPKGSVDPVYPLSERMAASRMDHRFFQKVILEALNTFSFSEPLPPPVVEALQLSPEAELLRRIHEPQSMREIPSLFTQIKFRELAPLCLQLEQRVREQRQRGTGFPSNGTRGGELLKQLPFTLTPGQEKALKQLQGNLAAPHQTVSLLQGDVGSGKTLTALLAALPVLEKGHQTAFMVPTEILAEQHAATLGKWLDALKIPHLKLTGSLSRQEQQEAHQRLHKGEVLFTVGTHSLINRELCYSHLGLVIIDEQHRFGVDQREQLVNKGEHPDVILMSATPIPRSLSQSLFGDVDLVTIEGKPPGRLPVSTRLVPYHKRREMLAFIAGEAAKGNQVFWVAPRIVERGSEGADIAKEETVWTRGGGEPFGEAEDGESRQSVEALVKELQSTNYSWKLAAVHGQMDADTRRKHLEAFHRGQLDILVATTVIEVGLDIPGANLMVVENPDRFGLAQLHQLRGRVGRGDKQAWCFLALPQGNFPPEAQDRLRHFCRSHDGFELSELDLKQRGSGSLDGVAQSGFGALKYTDLLEDLVLVKQVRQICRNFVS